MSKIKRLVTHQLLFDNYTIQVINMRDGFAWFEYSVTRAGKFLVESDDQHGSAAAAASAAFQWIAHHGEAPASLTNEQIQ